MAGVVRKPEKHRHCYGRRRYADSFSSLSTTVGVVLYRITIYPLHLVGYVVCSGESN